MNGNCSILIVVTILTATIYRAHDCRACLLIRITDNHIAITYPCNLIYIRISCLRVTFRTAGRTKHHTIILTIATECTAFDSYVSSTSLISKTIRESCSRVIGERTNRAIRATTIYVMENSR